MKILPATPNRILDHALFFERTPVIASYLAMINRDPRTVAACKQEQQLRREYLDLKGPHTQLIERVYKLENETGIINRKPTSSLCIERLVHLFPNGENVRIDPAIIEPMAQTFIGISKAYLAASEFAYQETVDASSRFAHPKELLTQILAWTDFQTTSRPGDKAQLIAASDSPYLGEDGSAVIRKLVDIISPDGKAFFLGTKVEIGTLVYDICSANIRRGYPFRTVWERGCWNFEYFIGEYIRRTGFSPLANVVMTYAGTMRQPTPFVRISSAGDNWLLKFNFAKEGYLPND